MSMDAYSVEQARAADREQLLRSIEPPVEEKSAAEPAVPNVISDDAKAAEVVQEPAAPAQEAGAIPPTLAPAVVEPTSAESVHASAWSDVYEQVGVEEAAMAAAIEASLRASESEPRSQQANSVETAEAEVETKAVEPAIQQASEPAVEPPFEPVAATVATVIAEPRQGSELPLTISTGPAAISLSPVLRRTDSSDSSSSPVTSPVMAASQATASREWGPGVFTAAPPSRGVSVLLNRSSAEQRRPRWVIVELRGNQCVK